MSYPKTPNEIYNWIKENRKLIFWLLHRTIPLFVLKEYLNYYTKEDLLNVAYIAVSKASKTFDTNQNIKFNSWASFYIRTEFIKEMFNILPVHIGKKLANIYDSTFIKLINSKIYITQTTDPETSRSSEEFEPWLEIPDANEDIEYRTLTKIYIDEISKIIRDRYGERYLNIFLLRFRDNLSYREIGEIYNISRQRAGQIIERIFSYLVSNGYVDLETTVKLRKIKGKNKSKKSS